MNKLKNLALFLTFLVLGMFLGYTVSYWGLRLPIVIRKLDLFKK